MHKKFLFLISVFFVFSSGRVIQCNFVLFMLDFFHVGFRCFKKNT